MKSKVLIVDDSELLRCVTRRALMQAGVEQEMIHEAGDGQQALDVLDAVEGISLVLLDLNMPVMNGEEFVRAVREAGCYEELKIHVFSTESNKERLSGLHSMGVIGDLRKPCGPEDVRRLAEELLGGGA